MRHGSAEEVIFHLQDSVILLILNVGNFLGGGYLENRKLARRSYADLYSYLRISRPEQYGGKRGYHLRDFQLTTSSIQVGENPTFL